MQIDRLQAFEDNYLWVVQHQGHALVVDPGDPVVVQQHLAQYQLQLQAIVITHHHHDHIGGVPQLYESYPADAKPVLYGPVSELQKLTTLGLPVVDTHAQQRISIALGDTQIAFEVLRTPGHTLGHVAYYAAQLDTLFCGDTLFASGCGRLFEGTAQQMQHSLALLRQLPAQTKVCCAHEYTMGNLRFARHVEPDNQALAVWHEQATQLRSQYQATVPTTIGHELACNPFLRWDQPAVISVAQHATGTSHLQPAQVFAAIRTMKDTFKA